jgi:UDP-N-acetylmuramyl pentapeptide synthase
MGMNRPGEIAVLTKIADPDLGLITNVGTAHLEGLGSVSGIARAKWELAEGLKPGARLVINGDDEELMSRAAETGRDVVTFGVGGHNTFRALEVSDLGMNGVRFRVASGGDSHPVELRVAGFHHVMNALGAVALGVTAGVSPGAAAVALSRFSWLKGRFVVRRMPGGWILVDDTYNANPSSLRAALCSASGLVEKGGRLLAGLGSMAELGIGAVEAHREAGMFVAAAGAARLWAMGPYASNMINGAEHAGMACGHADVSDSHGRMAAAISEAARSGDVVFVKGSRSAEMERVVEILAGAAVSE